MSATHNPSRRLFFRRSAASAAALSVAAPVVAQAAEVTAAAPAKAAESHWVRHGRVVEPYQGPTPYIHVKYSDDAGRTLTAGQGETIGSYMGTLVDFNARSSTDPTQYRWVPILVKP